MTALLFRGQKLVLSGDASRMLRETISTKYLATNRTYELSVGSII